MVVCAVVSYPDATNKDNPQLEMHYKYGGNGQVKQIAVVNTGDAYDTTYGPEVYVIQFFHDDAGRLIRKVVRDNAMDDNTTRFVVDYAFDGRGQLTRERIWRYDNLTEMMVVTQDTEKTYDLKGNIPDGNFSDNPVAPTQSIESHRSLCEGGLDFGSDSRHPSNVDKHVRPGQYRKIG